MSTVVLKAFATYKKNPNSASVELLHGVKDAAYNKDAELELTLDNAPLGPDLKAPEGGLITLYGFKDRNDEVQRRRKEAAARGFDFQSVDIEVEVGRIEPGILDRDGLKQMRFANVARMSSVLQLEILEAFKTYSKQSRGRKRIGPEVDRIEGIATRPDLWAKLLADDPDFKHIEVLVIPVLEEGKVRYVAYLRNNFKYVDMVQNRDGVVIVLPKGVGKKIPRQA